MATGTEWNNSQQSGVGIKIKEYRRSVRKDHCHETHRTRFTAGAVPGHAIPKEGAVRKAILLIMGCLLLAFWPQKALEASGHPGDNNSKDPGGPSSATTASHRSAVNDLISKHAHRLGIDPLLVHAVIRQESGFDPGAISPKGAMGLMQLMPGTATLMGVSDPFDMEQNIVGGIKYLQHCLVRFKGDLTKALAAYNAGPVNVEKYDGCPPFVETRDYVNRITRVYNGQTPLSAGVSDRLACPPHRRLSPSALAVLKELYPYRSVSVKQIGSEHLGRSLPGRRTAMTPEAMAVLKELNPHRHRRLPGNVAHHPINTREK